MLLLPIRQRLIYMGDYTGQGYSCNAFLGLIAGARWVSYAAAPLCSTRRKARNAATISLLSAGVS